MTTLKLTIRADHPGELQQVIADLAAVTEAAAGDAPAAPPKATRGRPRKNAQAEGAEAAPPPGNGSAVPPPSADPLAPPAAISDADMMAAVQGLMGKGRDEQVRAAFAATGFQRVSDVPQPERQRVLDALRSA